MPQINLLFVGDVVGGGGCDILRRHLPDLKREKNIDITVVNGENSADGNGIHVKSAEHIFASGADIITTGNHAFRRREVYEEYDTNPYLLRPANFPPSAPGRGLTVIDKGRYQAAVINLMGVALMEPLDNPFDVADRLIAEAKNKGADIIFVDFHAEATSEKKCMGYYLDGRVSAVIGTHTHVQTADEQILPCGTAYLTDVGMTGPSQSVLGIDPPLAIKKQKEKLPVRFEYAAGKCEIDAAVIAIDTKTAKACSIERLRISD